MGMFDSFIDNDGNDWQTKEYDRVLAVWRAGDTLPVLAAHEGEPSDEPAAYQVGVIGDDGKGDGYAVRCVTVRDRVVVGVNVSRDPALPLYGLTESSLS